MSMLRSVLHRYRWLRSAEYRRQYASKQEERRLLNLPRYTPGVFPLAGRSFKFIDGPSCSFIYQEIFKKEIYKFATDARQPYIIDAGANVGMSVVYFKRLFPTAKVIAFEPDNSVFETLTANVATYELTNVDLVKKALWNEETTLTFYSEGADAGRLSTAQDKAKIVEVPTVRLRPYLQEERVDFLKMDIEGAEVTVLMDCADLLHNVDRLFVEYHSFVGQEQRLPELLALLKKAGFRLNINTPGLTSASPFVKVETYGGMDMQLNIYAFRN